MKTKVQILTAALGLIAILGLGFTVTASGQQNPGEQAQAHQFIELMGNYLGLSNHWVETASKPDTAIYLAIEGIIEVYEERGEKARAIPHLVNIVQKNADNRSVRNIARFKLRDLYKETGQAEKALEQLELVIEENSR